MGRRRPAHATTDTLEQPARERQEDAWDERQARDVALVEEVRALAEGGMHGFKRRHADRFKKGWKR